MSFATWLDPRSAQADKSIWQNLTEDKFRHHLVQLAERTNSVPMEPEVFSFESWLGDGNSNNHENHLLPFAVEHQLADDFALLAAVEEGAQSVAAACIEEFSDGKGLTVVLAAMDAVKPRHQDALSGIARALMDLAHGRYKDVIIDSHSLPDLRGRIFRLHRNRIIARLRSVRWPKPQYLAESHKKPLWKDFTNLIHRAQFLYSKREQRSRFAIQLRLQKLALLYEGFEDAGTDFLQDQNYLTRVVEESYRLCTCDDMKAYVHRLQTVRATAQVAAAIKCVRQIEKIAAYWRIPMSLLRAVEQYPSLFMEMNFQYLTPYKSIPTSIAYESWAKTCHVHAEVQLAAYYDLQGPKQRLSPRVIGTSKYMCFLCLLFVKAHGKLFPASTHGRLYDQWTIPDLAEYSTGQTQRYRRIIQEMNDQILEIAVLEPKWRPEPMTSRQDLSQLAGALPAWVGTGNLPASIPPTRSRHAIDKSSTVLPTEQRIRS